MNIFKQLRIQLTYVLRFLLGSRRFVDLSLPRSNSRYIVDRISSRSFEIVIRDVDDWIQVEHIFLNEEFNLGKTGRSDLINDLHRKMLSANVKPLIIDLGANIGLASKYFDLAYPSCHIVAVEPDGGNCLIARTNLPYNAVLKKAAISSRSGTGNLIATGRNVGFRVESNPHGDVEFLTVQDLLTNAQGLAPFLIKIDVEGFESDLFSENTDWIDLFPVLLIELHDWMLPGEQVTKNFLVEISKKERDFMHFDGYVASISRDLSGFTVL
jgi:FkbM family methyltransferase